MRSGIARIIGLPNATLSTGSARGRFEFDSQETNRILFDIDDLLKLAEQYKKSKNSLPSDNLRPSIEPQQL